MGFDSQTHLVEIVAALKDITARVTAAATLPEAVDDLLKVTTDILPSHIRCGVTMISQGEPPTFAAQGLPSEVLDEAQHADGDGPCMEAIRTRDVVLSQDLVADERWPEWSTGALRHGVRGVLSYPFDVDTLTLAALNLYAGHTHAFVEDVPLVAMLLSDHASLLLRARLRQLSQDELLASVNDVRPGDATLERAIGIIMAQRGCPPDQALRHLHEAATNLGVGLSTIAERLVRTVGDRGGVAAD